MRSRFIAYSVAATLVIGGFAFAADAFVVSDEEELELVAESLLDGSETERVDALLRTVDATRLAVRVGDRRYEDNDTSLDDAVGDAIGPLLEPGLEVVQRSVTVRGERGTIALRVRREGELRDGTLQFTRSGQGWLLSRVAVQPLIR